MRTFIVSIVFLGVLLALWQWKNSANSFTKEKFPEPVHLKVKVLTEYPHDPQAFTQGLIFHAGSLYESTGLYRQSTLRKIDRRNGKVLQTVRLPDHLFGEGLERMEERLIQLTWKERVAVVYDVNTLNKMEELDYDGEGWGLCFDGQKLIRSDGTSTLTIHDPGTLAVTRKISVTLRNEPLSNINELEWVKDSIYANVWPQNIIVRIDPITGNVDAVIDASGLLGPQESSKTDVLNGIAFDPQTDTFLITGKLWPKLFEVVFVPRSTE